MPKSGYKTVKWLFGKEIEIPEEWNNEKLEKTSRLRGGYAFKSEDYVESGISLLKIANVSHEKILWDEESHLPESYWNEYPEFQLKNGDLVIAMTRPIISSGIKVAKIKSHKKILLNQRVGKFETVLDVGFLNFIVNSNYFIRQIEKGLSESNQPNISSSEVEKILVWYPDIQEQQKIATILSNVDDLINKYDEIIHSTKLLKRGLMQKLLTKGIGHKKFKKIKWLFGKEIEVPEEWNVKKIGDIFKLKSGSTPSRTKPEYFEGYINWITSTDLNRSKINSTLEKITADAVSQSNLTMLPKGTFLIATYGLEAVGTRGKCGITEMESTCNQACMAFLPSKEVLTEFLFYFYLYFGEKIVFRIAQGTKQQNLYSDTVKKVSMLIPTKEEQKRIVSIFNAINGKISDLESKKSNLDKIKKGLMQKLLTGQIRVPI